VTKEVKRSFDHIEIVTLPNTKLFELKILVQMEDWEVDDGGCTALEWIHNLLHLASEGKDIKSGAAAFLQSMLSVGETEVHICKIEKVEG
jgi:hypothetical protein